MFLRSASLALDHDLHTKLIQTYLDLSLLAITAVEMPSWNGSILIKTTSSSPYATFSGSDKAFLCDSLAKRKHAELGKNSRTEEEPEANEAGEEGLPALLYPDGPPAEGSEEREKEWTEVVAGLEKGTLFA